MKDISYGDHMNGWLRDPAHTAKYLSVALEDGDCPAMAIARCQGLAAAIRRYTRQVATGLPTREGARFDLLDNAPGSPCGWADMGIPDGNPLRGGEQANASGASELRPQGPEAPRAEIEIAKCHLAEDEHA